VKQGCDILLSDLKPLVYEFPDNNDIIIYPISDLHIGAREAMVKEWDKFKKRLKEEDYSYIAIAGDMMNNGTKNSVTNVYEETMRPMEQKKWLVEQLSDIKDKILCVVPGNHENRSVKEVDDNPLYDVCCKLDIEDKFRENMAVLILRLGNVKGNGLKNPTYTGAVLHGSGGGTLTGSAINKNERFAYSFDGLDFMIVGHTHKPVNTVPSKIVVDKQNKRVSLKPFRVIVSTSWLNYAGYAIRKQLLPSTHSLNELHLCGSKKEMKVVQ
jgi:predicted phosphodiesterase